MLLLVVLTLVFAAYAIFLIRMLSIRVPVVTFVNNHFAGYAHETIRQLQEVLGPALEWRWPLAERRNTLF